MTLQILNKKEKQEIENKLNEQFGIEKIPGLIIKSGKERFFLFTGLLDEKEIKRFDAPIERIGVYFAKEINDEIKLSIEGTQILKEQIKKNIFEINEEQMQEWMIGADLGISSGKKGFLVIKYKSDFLGCGKASENKIGNYIPKSRRLKYKELN